LIRAAAPGIPTSSSSSTAEAAVAAQRLRKLLADREDRIEAGEGVLEDDADPSAADRLERPVADLQQVDPIEVG